MNILSKPARQLAGLVHGRVRGHAPAGEQLVQREQQHASPPRVGPWQEYVLQGISFEKGVPGAAYVTKKGGFPVT